MPPFALALALFVVQFATLIAFQHRPGRRHMRAEWKPFKARLKPWVRRVEGAILFVFWIVLFGLLDVELDTFNLHWRPMLKGIGLEAALVDMVAAGMTAWPLAALAANAVSYAIAPIHRANQAAFEGLGTASLRRANIELAQMAAMNAVLSAPFVLYAAWYA